MLIISARLSVECGVWRAASCSIRIACGVRPYTPIGGAAQSSSPSVACALSLCRFFSDKVNIKKPLQHICKNHFDEKYTIYPDIYYFCIVNNKHAGCDAGCDETN